MFKFLILVTQIWKKCELGINVLPLKISKLTVILNNIIYLIFITLVYSLLHSFSNFYLATKIEQSFCTFITFPHLIRIAVQ